MPPPHSHIGYWLWEVEQPVCVVRRCICCQPAYLCQLLQYYEPVLSLQSSTENLVCKSAVGTVLVSRGFRHSAVSVWNNLSDNVREAKTFYIFKCKPKTHLCKLVFDT